jgi:hypothetical protein
MLDGEKTDSTTIFQRRMAIGCKFLIYRKRRLLCCPSLTSFSRHDTHSNDLLNDSAYISTTTIGIGDFFLEPEVITGRDLIIFPPLILIGYVFFSAFLGKLAELVAQHDDVPGQTLQDRLAATKFLRCHCRRRGPPN